jgi:hypothetical protein
LAGDPQCSDREWKDAYSLDLHDHPGQEADPHRLVRDGAENTASQEVFARERLGLDPS